MIFLTVGVQLPFDRLVRAVDDWAGLNPGIEILAQVGRSKYRPRHMRAEATLTAAEFDAAIERATLVVAHAGMGSIITALERGRPIVVMPRRADLGEHRNDHQLATAGYLRDRNLVMVADDPAELAEMLGSSLAPPSGFQVKPRVSPALLDRIRSFVA